MFAARYFNPRYWARRYCPKVGGSSTAESAPVFAGRANDFRATRVKDFGAGRVNDYRAVRIRP